MAAAEACLPNRFLFFQPVGLLCIEKTHLLVPCRSRSCALPEKRARGNCADADADAETGAADTAAGADGADAAAVAAATDTAADDAATDITDAHADAVHGGHLPSSRV